MTGFGIDVLEVEAKFKSPGNEKVEKALQRLGAKKLGAESVEDVYFSHPSRDFGRTDESLRLRKTELGSELTYKGPRIQLEGSKAREEITVRPNDALAAQRIVERLGFRERLVIRKKRNSYLLEKLRVDLDDVEDLGEYVEIELLTESPEYSAKVMESVRKDLELERLEPRTYLEMILERKEGKLKS